jgi:hypothetical protein
MEQMTYEQVLATIDREAAAQFVATSAIYLGGLLNWGADEFEGVQEGLWSVLQDTGLPSVGDQDDEALKFWGTLGNELGYVTDYEPDEDQDEEPVSGANPKRVVWYTNESFFDRETDMYVVAQVTEDEAGYDVYARYATVEAALEKAADLNALHGMSADVVLTVVASSMRLGNRS